MDSQVPFRRDDTHMSFPHQRTSMARAAKSLSKIDTVVMSGVAEPEPWGAGAVPQDPMPTRTNTPHDDDGTVQDTRSHCERHSELQRRERARTAVRQTW
eukprot:2866493-Prymnesium_polylepis.1